MPQIPDYVYEGEHPYIFISYAHNDRHVILPLIRGMQNQGFRIWYDAGIEHGSEWQDNIARHLIGSHRVIAFLSSAFTNSRHCRNELSYSVDLNKELFIIHLEDCSLSPGIKMQIGSVQAMFRREYDNDSLLLEALCKESSLLPCRDLKDAKAEEDIQQFDPYIIALGKVIDAQERYPASLNPRRVAQLHEAYRILVEIGEASGALVTYNLNEPYRSMGTISLCGSDLIFEEPAKLARAVALSSNVEIYPKTDGTIKLNFTFHGLTIRL